MGEIADQMFDEMMDRMYFFNRDHKPVSYQKGSGDYKWRTADGNVLSMRDMDTKHLRNAMRICEQHNNTGKLRQLREVLMEREADPASKQERDIIEIMARAATKRTGPPDDGWGGAGRREIEIDYLTALNISRRILQDLRLAGYSLTKEASDDWLA